MTGSIEHGAAARDAARPSAPHGAASNRLAALAVALGTAFPFGSTAKADPPTLEQPAALQAGAETAVLPAERPASALLAAGAERLRTLAGELWPEAERRGVARAVFDRALAGLEPDPEILALHANQPEHSAAPWEYLARLVSDKRIEIGRQKLAEHADLLAAIEARFGVDRHIVLAVWGVESSYGAASGSRHVIRSLATLAVVDQRRPQFWRSELLAALTVLQRGDIAIEHMTGSWAGAMGHTQFMPSSYLAHAVDHDGDGRRDIWGSVGDALASTANYLRAAGWRGGEPWGAEVILPAGFDLALTRPGLGKPLAAWQALGLTAPSGRDFPALASQLVLVLPAGAGGPAFLTTPNFRAVLRYNNAVPYALAVGHLADRIRGGEALAGLWPLDDPPLNRQGREELQRGLARLGYDVGSIDGLIGSATRAAIRAFQHKHGLPEDGYAGDRLLARIREAATR